MRFLETLGRGVLEQSGGIHSSGQRGAIWDLVQSDIQDKCYHLFPVRFLQAVDKQGVGIKRQS